MSRLRLMPASAGIGMHTLDLERAIELAPFEVFASQFSQAVFVTAQGVGHTKIGFQKSMINGFKLPHQVAGVGVCGGASERGHGVHHVLLDGLFY